MCKNGYKSYKMFLKIVPKRWKWFQISQKSSQNHPDLGPNSNMLMVWISNLLTIFPLGMILGQFLGPFGKVLDFFELFGTTLAFFMTFSDLGTTFGPSDQFDTFWNYFETILEMFCTFTEPWYHVETFFGIFCDF